MREMATFLGVLMLLPGACSLLVMMGLGPSNSLSLMLGPFRFGHSDDYGMLALLIWGGSFIVSMCGMLILWRLRKFNQDSPLEGKDNQKPG